MAEVVVVAVLVAAGAAAAYVAGVRSPALLAGSGLPLGCALYGSLSLLLAPLRPQVASVLAALALAAVAAAVAVLRREGARDAATLGSIVAVHAVLASALRLMSLVNVTPDSFSYLISASIIGRTGDLGLVDPTRLLERQWTLPALHSLAMLGDELYLRSLAPLLAVSGIVLLVWFAGRVLTLDMVPAGLGTAVVLLIAAFVISTNRFVYHAFYVNGHMLFAVLALVAVGATLLRIRGDSEVGAGSARALVAISAAGLVPLRPEAPVVALLLVAPFLVARTVPSPDRAIVAGAVGAATAWWSGLLWQRHLVEDLPVPTAVSGLTVVGVATLLFAGILPRLDRWSLETWLVPAHLLLWAALAAAAVRSPGVLAESTRATVENQLSEGLWGYSLIVLGALVVILLATRWWPAQYVVAFPLLSFVPLGALLALVREAGAYRVGPGDSLNRMLMHVLLVAALAVVAAAGSEPRWGGIRRGRQRTQAG